MDELPASHPDPVAYWLRFVPWLRSQPRASRVELLQQCIQKYGPAPDGLRGAIETALTAPDRSDTWEI